MIKYLKFVILTLALISASAASHAQTKKKPARPAKNTPSAPVQSTKKPARLSQSELDKESKKTREDVITKAKEYKISLEVLLSYQEADVKAKAEIVKKREDLLVQNIISKLELEKSKQELAVAQKMVAETRKQMGDSDNLIAEMRAAEQLAKMPPARVGAYQTTAALIRYNGPSRWVLADASKVESFFLSRFRRSLPVSAFGQTEVHNRLGFDHRNSVDVAVHPDSAEGQAIMTYLRGAGIPFIAFRQAVAGSATGAHIHIGYPSHRIAR